MDENLIDPQQPAPEPFSQPVCAECRYPIGQSLYGVLCDECGGEWLYQRESERVLTFAELAARALTGEVVVVGERWRIC